MQRPLLASMRLLVFSIFLQFLMVSNGHAQSVSGTGTDLNYTPGTSIVVDNALTITGGGTITNASVLIDGAYGQGDLLSMNDGLIPSGGSSSFNSGTGRLTVTGSGTAAEWEAALRTVEFSSTALSGGTRKVIFTIGDAIYNVFNNHYYEFVPAGISWTSAKAAAEASSLFGLTGYLATITDADENTFVSSKLQADGWIGSSDDYAEINAATGTTTYADQSGAEGNWYWVSGPEKGTLFSQGNFSPTTITYAAWNGGEPNDLGGENFGQIYFGNGSWNDLSDGNSLGYVVEYGDMPGDPVLNLSHTRNIIVPPATLTGDGSSPSTFHTNNLDYPVDVTIQFNDATSVTNVTVAIAEGFDPNDALDFNPLLLPGTLSANYDPAKGILSFSGTALVSEWNPLLQSVVFKTNSSSHADRKITFTVGTLPASVDGHYFILGDYSVNFTELPYYFQWYQPELSEYMGYQGYQVNINSISENEFLHYKIATEFWIPLSDEYTLINTALNTVLYNDQSESEGKFYWLLGPAAGTLVSTGDAPSMVPELGQYNNWETTQPDNLGNYSQATYFNPTDGKWYDETFYDDFDYLYKQPVIEYGGSPGDPVNNLFFAKTMTFLASLPVTLTKFEVRKVNTTAVIDWTTESEEDYSYFSLERSGDNRNFTPIAKLSGRGPNQGRQDYRFIDQHPLNGFSYYRLKMVDTDSTFSYSPVRMLDFRSILKNRVYPTIVTQELFVELADPANVRCTIINASGAVVKVINPASTSFSIPVGSFAKGAYMLTITDNKGGKETWTFIKQ